MRQRGLNLPDWYLLRVRTAGLLGSINLGQGYDRANACPTCGAGARPVPPLVADLPRMGKKTIDRTAHDGRVITTRHFSKSLVQLDRTGFTEQPVRSRGNKRPHPGFVWLDVTAEWPPIAPSSELEREDQCPRCGRAGHFDCAGRPTRLRVQFPNDPVAEFTPCDFDQFQRPPEHPPFHLHIHVNPRFQA